MLVTRWQKHLEFCSLTPLLKPFLFEFEGDDWTSKVFAHHLTVSERVAAALLLLHVSSPGLFGASTRVVVHGARRGEPGTGA